MSEPDGRPGADQTASSPENPKPNRGRAVLGAVVVAAVVLAAGFAVYHQRRGFADAVHKVGFGVMAASLALAVVSTALTFPTWRAVLTGLQVDMPWGVGARVFFTSQLGKYLPGSVWPVLIQMEAGRSRGAARRTMLAANLITIVLSCAVGLSLACVLLPIADAHALRRYWWLLFALPFLLALLHPRAVPWALDRLFTLVRREPLGQRLPVNASLRASGWALSSFVASGLHIAVLVVVIGGAGISAVTLSIGAMALAVSAGVLFIPAPAGAGVRDVVLTLVLGSVLDPGQALAVVVTSRALLIAGDLALAVAAGVAARLSDRNTSVNLS
ncbi:MAG: flippase-like domain-containing protein [Actinomycetota bacterium]|nr:flippase-like domain-containing protein [Actinomycetota bacterium]